jgi:hypothetical protein
MSKRQKAQEQQHAREPFPVAVPLTRHILSWLGVMEVATTITRVCRAWQAHALYLQSNTTRLELDLEFVPDMWTDPSGHASTYNVSMFMADSGEWRDP